MLTMEMQDAKMPGLVMPMVDNILLLETVFAEDVERTIRLVKTRGSGYDPRRHRLKITSEGVLVERKR